ncbi:DUF1573 domain-containing protein [Prevotella sp. MGM1]|nr:DUF1573 domain-containing protein [Prevotella sp. MGM1]
MEMKTIITQLLLLAAMPVAAQRLTVAKKTVDCGKVAYEKPVTATFELRNKGIRKLKITEVKAGCGCTKVEYPTEDIPAGDKFTLRLTYDSRQLGHFDKSVRIVSNGSKQPVYLNMKGVVVEDLKDYSASYPFAIGELLTDRNEIEFDDVNKGDNPVQEIYIMNAGTKVFTPNMMHLPPYLSAVVTPERLAPGRSGKIEVMLNSAKLHDFGLTQTSVYLARNIGEKISNDNEITVSAVLLPDFTGMTGAQRQYAPKMKLSAETLDIAFDGKSKKTEEIVITNNGRTALKITSLQMFTSGLKVTLGKREIAAGETTKLKITAQRDELKKLRSKPRVLMITNDPDKPKVAIEVRIKND